LDTDWSADRPADWFATRLLTWFDQQGRHDLPWRRGIDAYRVWVSEIMLQQTQVATVVPYFERFLARFPDLATLADAELDEVLHHWSGLGYYARGRNLHRAARQVVADHNGQLPPDVDALAALPGIGRSTAGAIAAIAYDIRAPILDGNVKRVLARFHAVAGHPGESGPLRRLWDLAEQHTPPHRSGDYAQAIMDLGATLCTRARPRCGDCPVRERCAALRDDVVAAFPGRKPTRDKPIRAARMFLLVDPGGHCLLQRRPPSGLWGGLWTPPERPPEASVADVCAEFAIRPENIATMRAEAPFRHTFTHFHLDIEPVYVTLAAAPATAADRPDVCWYHPAAAGRPSLGLSAPAAKLLATLSPTHDHTPTEA
jgi:A/G-specific adenine glycosylase